MTTGHLPTTRQISSRSPNISRRSSIGTSRSSCQIHKSHGELIDSFPADNRVGKGYAIQQIIEANYFYPLGELQFVCQLTLHRTRRTIGRDHTVPPSTQGGRDYGVGPAQLSTSQRFTILGDTLTHRLPRRVQTSLCIIFILV